MIERVTIPVVIAVWAAGFVATCVCIGAAIANVQPNTENVLLAVVAPAIGAGIIAGAAAYWRLRTA